MSSYKALVVDDSASMRRMITFALARLPGLETTEADDGIHALNRLRKERFDILLTDINMPIMDGLKLVSMVRSEGPNKDIPIIIVTTRGAVEDRQRGLALGANVYITKPVQAPEVVHAVRDLLEI